MPRTARLRLPGYPLHVVQRGHNRAPCFLDDRGRRLYLALLTEFAQKRGCNIHAYVLMTNHLHLLATPQEPFALSRLMKDVNQRYVQHVNRRHDRSGSMWEGRYWCSFLDTGRYILSCYRYIECNPVRAGIASTAAEYPWSSHATNALGAPSALITFHPAYRSLGEDEGSRRRAFRAFFERPAATGELDAIRAAIASGLPFGSPAFLAGLQAQGARIDKGSAGRPRQEKSGTYPDY